MDKQLYMFELIEQWQTSGLTKKVFCHNHDIRTNNFSFWFKRWKESKSEASDGFIAITPEKAKLFQIQYRLSYPNGVQLEVSGVGFNQLARLINL